MEASLIVVIVSAYLKKIGRKDLNRYLFIGSGAAIMLSLVLGIAIFFLFGGLGGIYEKLFEGMAAITATLVLTYMIFWMARRSKSIRGELEEKVDVSISRGYLMGIASVAFVAVFREGVETVLFLSALISIDVMATILGAFFGIGTSLALALLMVRGIYRLNLTKFFSYTSLLLVVFAAGLLGFGMHELVEAGEEVGIDVGILGEKAFDLNPEDASHPLHEKGSIGSLMTALVGYDGNPEWLRVLSYIGYWTLIGPYLLRTYSPENPLSRILFRNGRVTSSSLRSDI